MELHAGLFNEYSQYMPDDSGFELWTESYGDLYGPDCMHFFEEQNLEISNKTNNATAFRLQWLGVGNGYIDQRLQLPPILSWL